MKPPTNRVWSLTVVDGRLALVAPHGTLFVRGATPEITAVVANLPAGTELKCRGDGTVITNLVVTEIESFQSDLTPHALTLPDGAVEQDARLALLRARARLDAGDVIRATADLAIALGRGAGVDGAIAQVGRLPADARETLRDAVARWQHTRPANWRALQDVPLTAWTTVHLGQALKQALAKPAETFGDSTITAAAMIAELERRGATDEAARWQAKRDQQQPPATPREVGPWMQLSTKLVDAHVVGADADGIYLAGNQLSYETIRERARTFVREQRTPVVVCYGLDGTERRRWPGATADRVVDGVMITGSEVRRIADDQVLVRFRDLRRYDDELLWGDVDTKSRPASEVRRITGELVVRFTKERVSDVTWDRDHIFVDGTHPRTLDRRTGRLVREGIPTATTVDVELANRRLTIPAAAAASWTSHVDWGPRSGGNYRIVSRGRCLLVNEMPSNRWIVLELAREPQLIDVAPPWLAFWFEVDTARFTTGGGGPTAPVRKAQPILLVAIAELVRSAELRIGEWFSRRRSLDPVGDKHFAALAAMHTDLVEIGVIPACTDAERDARVLDEWLIGDPPTAATFVRIVKRWSPFYVEHDLDPIGAEDGFYAGVTRALADEGIVVSEAGRRGARTSRTITLRVTRGTTIRERVTEPIIDILDGELDALLAEVGSTRSLVRIVDDEQRCGYLLVTPAQAARLP